MVIFKLLGHTAEESSLEEVLCEGGGDDGQGDVGSLVVIERRQKAKQ